MTLDPDINLNLFYKPLHNLQKEKGSEILIKSWY